MEHGSSDDIIGLECFRVGKVVSLSDTEYQRLVRIRKISASGEV